MQYLLSQRAQALDYLARGLVSPLQQIEKQRTQLAQLRYRLESNLDRQLQTKQHNLLRLSQNLHHLNPNAVLTRGYAFVQNQAGHIISNSNQLQKGEAVKLTFDVGTADAVITQTGD
jgi:exodeoxyribonuclease VII large subunit